MVADIVWVGRDRDNDDNAMKSIDRLRTAQQLDSTYIASIVFEQLYN